MGDNLSVADVLALNGNGGNMFGGNGTNTLLLFLILFGGAGGLGFGNRGNFGLPEVEAGFRNNTIVNKLDGITQGICDSTYALNNSIMSGFATIGSQIANCCCETNRNIDASRYEMSKGFCDVINANTMNTRDILENQNANTQRIVDTIQGNVIQDLRDKLNSANALLAQDSQSRYILGELGRYVTNPPCTQFGYGYGCGSCC